MKEKEIGARREKIESKGAYAYDLHEAIRDVRRALANGDYSRVGSRLNALYDICAPEIREAIKQEWDAINEKYGEEVELYRNAEYCVYTTKPRKRWEEKRDGNWKCNIWVHASSLTRPLEQEIAERERNSLLRKVWDGIYRERFRACIDCLDRHGELRKWREVEYGKL